MHTSFEEWFPALILPAFAAFWIAISYVISVVGGWRELAQHYRAAEFSGECWHFQSAAMRWSTRYGNVLTVGANAQGLYLAVLFLFRAGHPPLFVPWADIELRLIRGTIFRYVTIELLQHRGIFITVSKRLGYRIARASGQRIRDGNGYVPAEEIG